MKHVGLSQPEQGLSHRYFILAVTGVVIAVLMYVVSSKLEQEVENAEWTQFEFRLAELRSAVLLQEAVLVAKDQADQAYRYEGLNPMIWMAPETSHYLGEMSLESVSGQEGNWVFDPKRKVIAYKGQFNEFSSEKNKTESKWLQFKVVALWSKEERLKEKGSKENTNLVSKGLRLKQVYEAR